ncbi:RluA family pseudouridine synthase [Oceanobacillus bengalensis]|uniref:Pseudouridine synthase n=1 Tax=Oceanobacillus bengalensis TaxID=1435466 RepID=A0A494YWP8_9BACI|nr:RluA family pseudouridine synthase [Oceanobacillus bengalensis]RKQ14137.1 RluA family pseudouridine synthase [Oceanobacillus bengalensis]
MKVIITNQHHGMIIRDYLREVHRFSRRILIAVKESGKIHVNDSPQTVRYPLEEGDVLEIVFPKEEIAAYMNGDDTCLSIVYEDDAVIVVDKPAGMATIPSLNHPSGTVANGILSYYEKNNIPYTVHVVTRLDRDTSGLLLIAKHRYSHSLLATAQKEGRVKRRYKAIVEGVMESESGTLDAPIDRKEGSIIERTVAETGKRAITHYKVRKNCEHHTYVEVELETGRTHQIRVHFSHINHPLAGDDLYGGAREGITRHALHCFQLSFEHPFTKEEIKLESKLPWDMKELLNQM